MMDEGVRTTDDRAGASLNSFSFQSSILSFLRLQVILEQWGSLTAYFSLSRKTASSGKSHFGHVPTEFHCLDLACFQPD
jgi:hypothetical protein